MLASLQALPLLISPTELTYQTLEPGQANLSLAKLTLVMVTGQRFMCKGLI